MSNKIVNKTIVLSYLQTAQRHGIMEKGGSPPPTHTHTHTSARAEQRMFPVAGKPAGTEKTIGDDRGSAFFPSRNNASTACLFARISSGQARGPTSRRLLGPRRRLVLAEAGVKVVQVRVLLPHQLLEYLEVDAVLRALVV
jgi:hypothetical protein